MIQYISLHLQKNCLTLLQAFFYIFAEFQKPLLAGLGGCLTKNTSHRKNQKKTYNLQTLSFSRHLKKYTQLDLTLFFLIFTYL